MSSPAAEGASDKVSKVTFSPVSDSTGNQALIVTIKSVAGEVPRLMDTPKLRSMSLDSRRSSSDSKRKTRSRTSPNNKSTMTDGPEERSQTSISVPEATSTSGMSRVKSSSSAKRTQETSSNPTTPRKERLSESTSSPKDSPCLKHAAENITRKASTIESEKVSLCNNCSKSMLSYIFVVQDFLDSLAKEICGNADSQDCLQCLRHEARIAVSPASNEVAAASVGLSERRSSKSRTKSHSSKIQEDSNLNTASSRTKVHARDSRTNEETAEHQVLKSQHRQVHQQEKQSYVQSTNTLQGNEQTHSTVQVQYKRTREYTSSQDHQDSNQAQHGPQKLLQDPQSHHSHHDTQSAGQTSGHHVKASHPGSHDQQATHQTTTGPSTQPNPPELMPPNDDVPFRRPIHRQRPDFMFHRDENEGRNNSTFENEGRNNSTFENEGRNNSTFENERRNNSTFEIQSPFSDGVDGIISTLSTMEREVYDAARDGAGWEGLSEERLVSSNPIPSEAYVTMCRNNAEALGCLVVGTSLLLSRTSRTLCVVVSDGVSNAFRGPLSSVFHAVQCVRSLDSLGTTKLALLEQPEIGVSFDKLNVWRLVQFSKCVFLNPDTLVIQNCDELFCREELSAVADIGWPDCFNSGVFVFTPSTHTFWKLIEHAEKQGSYDGGDQGLLNSYFCSWSEDIGKKLSFVYNLMANVSYTYTPAFKQFGRNVKVVQFHGSSKPWHVKFRSRTGEISSETAVHPTYVQFVHIWINIFRISAIRQMPQEIKSYAQSQDLICAVELLRFYPLPSESEAEFFLAPPSVRLRIAERQLQKTVVQRREELQRRKSAEFPSRYVDDDISRDSTASPNDGAVTSRDGAASTRGGAATSRAGTATTIDGASASGDGAATSGDCYATSGDGASISYDGAATTSDGTATSGECAVTSGDGAATSGDGANKADVGTIAESMAVGESVRPVKVENPLPGAEVGDYQGMKAWEQGRMDYQGTDSSDTIIKRLEFLMSQPK